MITLKLKGYIRPFECEIRGSYEIFKKHKGAFIDYFSENVVIELSDFNTDTCDYNSIYFRENNKIDTYEYIRNENMDFVYQYRHETLTETYFLFTVYPNDKIILNINEYKDLEHYIKNFVRTKKILTLNESN